MHAKWNLGRVLMISGALVALVPVSDQLSGGGPRYVLWFSNWGRTAIACIPERACTDRALGFSALVYLLLPLALAAAGKLVPRLPSVLLTVSGIGLLAPASRFIWFASAWGGDMSFVDQWRYAFGIVSVAPEFSAYAALTSFALPLLAAALAAVAFAKIRTPRTR